MANNFDITLLFLIAGQIIGLCVFIWQVAVQYGRINSQIERNRHDLNGAMISIREDLRSVYQLGQMQISHIQEHLAKENGYHPPSLKSWDKNFET